MVNMPSYLGFLFSFFYDDSYDGGGEDVHLGETAGPLQPSLVSLTRAGQHLTKMVVVRMNNFDDEQDDVGFDLT